MTTPDWINDIDERRGRKLVLLVEGESDREILGSMLRRMNRHYTRTMKIFEAKGREKVIQGLSHRNLATDGWWGIIDRDEATDAEAAALHAAHPTLRILPRYCIENFFVDPDEIWPLIPQAQQRLLTRGVQEIKDAVEPDVPKWVSHWAMWCVIRRKRKQLLETLRFPDQLLDRMTTAVLTEGEIKAELVNWHNHLAPDPIHTEFAGVKTSADAESLSSRYRRRVHGKLFFQRIISDKGLRLIASKPAAEWLLNFAESVARGRRSGVDVPTDLRVALQDVLTAAAAWATTTPPFAAAAVAAIPPP